MSAPPPSNQSPAALLADHAWARRLARQLVRDPSLADDLVQEACARALAHPPGREPRAWLGGIVRNLAREFRRERVRRERREAEVAQLEAQPSAADALERLSAQQDVVHAVLALEEPYRSTIVLRFYDELPPRKIAARAGVPVATVKTRLARGLALLRGALDKEHGGDGRAWALALLPLADHGPRFGPLAGPALMHTLAKLAVVTSAIVFVVWLARREPGAPAALGGASAAPTVLAELAPGPLENAPTPAVRESALPATPLVAVEPLTTTDLLVSGRVVDVDGLPVAGVALGLRKSNGSRMEPEDDPNMPLAFGSLNWDEPPPDGSSPLTTSGADGRFTLPLTDEYWGSVVSVDPHWESVLVPPARAREGQEQMLVVAPRFRLLGAVLGVGGEPLAGVELRFGVPRHRVTTPGVSLEDTLAPDWSTTSDELGMFEFPRLPAVPGARLRARLLPLATRTLEREQWSDDELEIVLERAPGTWLEGVVEAHGAPVAAAVVALGTFATKTDARGAFQIHLEGHEHEDELCAAAKGFLPTRVHGDRDADGSVRWPDFVRLALDGEALMLAGTVVDAAGAPLANQGVSLGEGRTVWREQYPILLESVLVGGHDARHQVTTDSQGRFELRGLEAHEYELIVVDPRTALVSHAGPFVAGRADLRIVQPTDQLWPVVRGVVVSGSGEPVQGLGVSVERDVDMVGLPGSMYFGFNAGGSRAETDALGAFELHDVPRNGVRLSTGAMGIVDPAFTLAPDTDPLAVRIVVDRWVELEVFAGSAQPLANGFALLDASGEALPLESALNGGITVLYRLPLIAGHAPVVKGSDRATVIVLYGPNGELARQALTLHTGIINRIDF